MYTTVEGKGEKHRSHVLASGTGGISWQVMAGPAAGMARALGSHRGCRVSVLGSKPACSSQSGVEKTAEAPSWSGAMQPASHIQQCPLGSIPLICLRASQLLWILFGGWLYATGVRTWLSSIYQHVHVSRQTVCWRHLAVLPGVKQGGGCGHSSGTFSGNSKWED